MKFFMPYSCWIRGVIVILSKKFFTYNVKDTLVENNQQLLMFCERHYAGISKQKKRGYADIIITLVHLKCLQKLGKPINSICF